MTIPPCPATGLEKDPFGPGLESSPGSVPGALL